MDIKEIKKIIELMKDNELSEFELAEEGFRITIRRPYASASPQVMMGQVSGYPQAFAPAPSAPETPKAADVAVPPAKDEVPNNWVEIKSPMVGTFYRSSTPESESFIDIDSDVSADSIVCIIEAMKVMNEIKAEVKGVIKKILVENATPVEYNQPLFLVDPS